jgi:autotransporter-associated beta strand protein
MGTLTLSGTNTFSGGGKVTEGVLEAGSANGLGTGSYEIAELAKLNLNGYNQTLGPISGSGEIILGTATLTVNQTGNSIFEGVITGGGDLVKTGDGILYLFGANSYAGGTAVSDGTLVGNSSSLTGDISVDNNATLTFYQEGDDDFVGTLSGSGVLTKSGSGKLVLNSASDSMGSVKVEAGTLIVGESLAQSSAALTAASFEVSAGAALGGHGTIVGNVSIVAGGSLSPGNSYGTQTVDGNLSFEPGGFFDVEVDYTNANNGDLTVVTGTAYLSGAIVRHFGTGGELSDYLDKQWTILQANALVGEFEGAVSDFAFLIPDLAYENNEVKLSFSAMVGLAEVVSTHNQKAVAASLETLPKTSELYKAIMLSTTENVGAMMNQLSGEVHGSVVPAVKQLATLANRIIVGHAFETAKLASLGLPPAAGDLSASHRLWLSLGGSYGQYRGTADAAKVVISGAELSLGYDFNLVNGFLGGLVLHFNNKTLKANDRSSDVDAKSYGVSAYLGKSFDVGNDSFRLLLGGNWTRYNFESTRSIVLPTPQTLKGVFNASSYQVYLEAAYSKRLSWGGIVEPYASIGWTRFDLDGFRETGGNAALVSRSEKQDNAFSSVGLRFSAPMGQKFTLDADLGWKHEFGNISKKKYLAFAEGGQGFAVNGVSSNKDELAVGLKGTVNVNDNWQIGLNYNGNFGNSATNHSGSLIISTRW